MPMPDLTVPQQTAIQFAQIRNLCHPSADTPVSAYRTPGEISGSVHARTDGRWLTHVNTVYFERTQVEERFLTLVHEVAHARHGSNGRRGCSSHPPAFWDDYVDNLNRILTDDTARGLVQSVFRDDIDWHRVRYRAVQEVWNTIIDRRCETVEERKRKIAEQLNGYDAEAFEAFEGRDVSVIAGHPDMMADRDPSAACLPDGRFASGVPDERIRAFLEEHERDDGRVAIPTPAVWVYPEEMRGDIWQIIRDDDRWDFADSGRLDEERLKLAAMDRCGIQLYATSLEHVLAAADPAEYAPSLDVDVSRYDRLRKPASARVSEYDSLDEAANPA